MSLIHVDEGNFHDIVLASRQPFLVDFSADWCPPCRQLRPILEDLARELTGRVRIGQLNAERAADLAREHAVTSLPTLLLFKDGEVQERIRGLLPKPRIRAKLMNVV